MKKSLLNIFECFQKHSSIGLKLTLWCVVMALLQHDVTAQVNTSSTAAKQISGKITTQTGEPLTGVR